jgi:hypothetical protein
LCTRQCRWATTRASGGLKVVRAGARAVYMLKPLTPAKHCKSSDAFVVPSEDD